MANNKTSVLTQTIKNWVAGISQQPPSLRHPEQLEEQINGFSTEAGGLQKRPPTLHNFRLGKVLNNNISPKLHIINRDNIEKYIVMLNGKDVEVFDIATGAKIPVTMQDNDNYLVSSDPRNNLKVITIADYTFIVNTGIYTDMSSAMSPNVWNTQGALVNVKSGQYGRTYRIVANGVEIASYTTPDGANTADIKAIDTNAIASNLATQCTNKGYKVQQGSSWLYVEGGTGGTQTTSYTKYPSRTPSSQYDYMQARINNIGYSVTEQGEQGTNFYTSVWDTYRNSGIDVVGSTYFTITVSGDESFYDTQDWKNLVAEMQSDYWTIENVYMNTTRQQWRCTQTPKVVTTTTSISSSPINTCEVYDGYNNEAMTVTMRTTQKFTNLPASAPNGFTVKIIGENKSKSDDYYVHYDATDQVWKETICPNIKIAYDRATMPHVLVRGRDGNFTFRRGEWADRLIGDEDSNPLPSFIGQTINDVFFFRNRLGFLSGENVILSSSSDFFNYFMQSAVAVQDTDPIDIAVSDNKVSTLYQAVPFGEDLVLFATDTQFAMQVDGVLTPTNAKADTLTYFTSDPQVRPIGAGRNIYFTAKRAKYTSVKEYFTAFDNSDKRDAQDITSHVPNYIPNGVYQIMSSTIDNVLMFLTSGDTNSLYVYKYLYIDGVKQQSAWSRWDVGAEIVGGGFIGSTLYLVVKREDYYCLESLIVTYNTLDFTLEPYRLYMDRKILTPTIPATSYDKVTGMTTLNLADYYGVSSLDNGTYIVATPKGVLYTVTDSSTIEIEGDLSGTKVIIGRAYSFKMTLGTIMIKSTQNGVTETTTDGRLQLQKVWFNYKDTGSFNVIVTHNGVDYTYVTSLYRFDSDDKFDVLHLKSGTFNVPIQYQNTKVAISLVSDLPTPIAIIGGGWNGRYARWTKLV